MSIYHLNFFMFWKFLEIYLKISALYGTHPLRVSLGVYFFGYVLISVMINLAINSLESTADLVSTKSSSNSSSLALSSVALAVPFLWAWTEIKTFCRCKPRRRSRDSTYTVIYLKYTEFSLFFEDFRFQNNLWFRDFIKISRRLYKISSELRTPRSSLQYTL